MHEQRQSHRIANQFLLSPDRAGGSIGIGGGGRQGQNHPLPDHHALFAQIHPHNPPNPPVPAQVIDNLQQLICLVPAGLVVEAEEHQMHMRRLMRDWEHGSPKPCNHDIDGNYKLLDSEIT